MILACGALCCAAAGAAAPKQVARPTSTEGTANSVLFILSSPKASTVQRRRSRQKWICLKWMAVGTLAGELTVQKWALRSVPGHKRKCSIQAENVRFTPQKGTSCVYKYTP